MRSALRFAIFSYSGLLILLLASPGFAQGLPAVSDPFAGVPAVDGAHLSAVNGQPGITGLPGAANPENGSEFGIACGAGSATSLVTPGTQQVTIGNSTSVRVTAINNQTSSIGSAVIDADGGGS